MVRFSHSHIRFGTLSGCTISSVGFNQKLLDHVIEQYYPTVQAKRDMPSLRRISETGGRNDRPMDGSWLLSWGT